MWRDAGLPQVGDELGCIEALVRAQRQLPGRSGGMTMDHIQRGAPFGMAVCLGLFRRFVGRSVGRWADLRTDSSHAISLLQGRDGLPSAKSVRAVPKLEIVVWSGMR